MTRKSVATQAHLPLHRAGWAARKLDGTRTVVLRATDRDRVRIIGKVAADIASVKLDRVDAGIHVDPGIPDATNDGRVSIGATEDAAIATLEEEARRSGHIGERVLIDVDNVAAAVAAGDIVKRCAGAAGQPNIEGIDKEAVRIVRIDCYSLVVPVLRIVALPPVQFRSEPPADPAIKLQVAPAIGTGPNAKLAAARVTATAVAVGGDRLHLRIDVVRVAWRNGDVHAAELVTGVDVAAVRRASAGIQFALPVG